MKVHHHTTLVLVFTLACRPSDNDPSTTEGPPTGELDMGDGDGSDADSESGDGGAESGDGGAESGEVPPDLPPERPPFDERLDWATVSRVDNMLTVTGYDIRGKEIANVSLMTDGVHLTLQCLFEFEGFYSLDYNSQTGVLEHHKAMSTADLLWRLRVLEDRLHGNSCGPELLAVVPTCLDEDDWACVKHMRTVGCSCVPDPAAIACGA